MRQLFLSSSFADVAGVFKKTLDEECKGKVVTFIPIASVPEKIKFYVDSARKTFGKLGIMVDELDLSTTSYEKIVEKIQTNDFIYVSGGNTFFLLQELRRTGTDNLIVEQINHGKYYIGESAGSIIVSPNIEYVKGMDDCRAAPDLTDYTALNILDFYPLPHYKNFPFKKNVEKIMAEYGDKIYLYPISNSQAILVENANIRVVS